MLASVCFYHVKLIKCTSSKPFAEELKEFLLGVFYAIVWGAKLVFTERNLIWLLPSYSIGLIVHRYVEGTIFPFFANEILKNPDYQTILTAGSNFGEFVGAVLVLFTARIIPTPIPFVRLGAILLFIGWVFYSYRPAPVQNLADFSWTLFPLMGLISLGWSAGDVSLAAHIQSNLGKFDNVNKHCTPLHAVFSFLYIFNLVFYFVFNVFMGQVRDVYKNNGYDFYMLFFWIGGFVLSISAVVILLGSIIPTGSWAWNPQNEEQLIETNAFDETTIKEAESEEKS